MMQQNYPPIHAANVVGEPILAAPWAQCFFLLYGCFYQLHPEAYIMNMSITWTPEVILSLANDASIYLNGLGLLLFFIIQSSGSKLNSRCCCLFLFFKILQCCIHWYVNCSWCSWDIHIVSIASVLFELTSVMEPMLICSFIFKWTHIWHLKSLSQEMLDYLFCGSSSEFCYWIAVLQLSCLIRFWSFCFCSILAHISIMDLH